MGKILGETKILVVLEVSDIGNIQINYRTDLFSNRASAATDCWQVKSNKVDVACGWLASDGQSVPFTTPIPVRGSHHNHLRSPACNYVINYVIM